MGNAIPRTTVPSNLSKLTHAQKDEVINALIKEINDVRAAANDMIKEVQSSKTIVVRPEAAIQHRTVKSGTPTVIETITTKCNCGCKKPIVMSKEGYKAMRKAGQIPTCVTSAVKAS